MDIKLIEKDTNISELKMSKMPWDVEVKGIPYQVVRIEGYVHSIGGRWGENNLWMYPRNENPTYETLIEYHCESCACVGELGMIHTIIQEISGMRQNVILLVVQ